MRAGERRVRFDSPARPDAHCPRVRLRRGTWLGTLLLAAAAAAGGPLTASALARPADEPEPATVVLKIRKGEHVRLHARPGGRTLVRLGARTEFGSRTLLTVLTRRGPWAQVSAALLGGRRVWLRLDRRVARRSTRWALYADISDRTLTAIHDGRVMKTFGVGVGAPGSPTPTGRFQVTDKLKGKRYGASYGCCILALSTDQPHPPAGWHGMARMAVHGTNVEATVGRAASAGCFHARAPAMRWLMRHVPVGAPIVIVR
jgi:L,D-transpeptidase-like protein